MNFASDELKNDYIELLEELQEIITNPKNNIVDNYKKEEYTKILKELFNDFKKPHIYSNPFEIKEMVRIVNYPYQKTPLSVKGSEITNGRYHVTNGGPRCFYLSSSEETSILETRIQSDNVVLSRVIKSPKSTFFLNGMLQNILDIRTPENCLERGISYELIFEDWQFLNIIYSLNSYTQMLAQMAFEYGYEGILYNSIKDSNGFNVVIFTENLKLDSFISVIGDNDILQEIEPNNRKIVGYLPNVI